MEKADTNETLHFRVDGSSIVRIARDCVLSERWEHAVSILRCMENDDGAVSSDTCFDILAGRKTLDGDSDSGMSIVREDAVVAAAVDKSQSYVYGGRFYHRGKWYRPYMTVKAGTQEDAYWAMSHVDRVSGNILSSEGMRRMGPSGPLPDGGGVHKMWTVARPLAYAYRPFEDLLVWVANPSGTEPSGEYGWEQYTAYLCETCNAPPLWRLLPGEGGSGTPVDTVHKRLRSRAVQHFDAHVALAEANRREAPAKVSKAEAEVVAATRKLQDDARAEREDEDAQSYERQVQSIRAAVRVQAGPVEGPGWLLLRERENGRAWRVPALPFRIWSLRRRFPEEARKVQWQTVSPVGMKLMLDIPQHTDWLLGGMELVNGGTRDLVIDTDYRDGDLNSAAYDKSWDIERLQMAVTAGIAYHVLVHGKTVTGTVVHPEPDEEVDKGSIVILPDGRAEWSIPAMSAAAVILEQGGELAHIVQLGMDENKPVFRIPGALARWPEGIVLTLDTATASVEVKP